MIVGIIEEFNLVGVYDRGLPNQERIVILANETVNAGQYGLMLGVRGSNGMAFPIRDNLLWFGDAIVTKGDWLFVYTGPGESTKSNIPNTEASLYTVHWGRNVTILNSQDVVPILFRVDAVQVHATSSYTLPGTNP